MKSKRDGFFWVSYTDLMISLFFIMLAVAAISIYQINRMRIVSEEKLNQIKKIQAIVQKLTEPENKGKPDEKPSPFSFNPKTGRFEINRVVEFPPNVDKIPASDKDWLEGIGRKLEVIVAQIQKEQQTSSLFNQRSDGRKNASYLIVIEGTASEEGACESNYQLSYRRAYALWDLWLNANIKLKIPGVSDVQVSGSGSQKPEKPTVACKVEEEQKKRGTIVIDPSSRKFKIQLVPLIPDLENIK